MDKRALRDFAVGAFLIALVLLLAYGLLIGGWTMLTGWWLNYNDYRLLIWRTSAFWLSLGAIIWIFRKG